MLICLKITCQRFSAIPLRVCARRLLIITTCMRSSIGHAVYLDCAFCAPLFLLSCPNTEVYACELRSVTCQSLCGANVLTYLSRVVFRMVKF